MKIAVAREWPLSMLERTDFPSRFVQSRVNLLRYEAAERGAGRLNTKLRVLPAEQFPDNLERLQISMVED